jgi:ribonuclease HI
MSLEEYVLVFDGGSIGNPGDSYGSFQIQSPAGDPETERRDFGYGTNNQAEYKTLIAGLRELHKRLKRERVSPHDVSLELRGDSQLVLRQIGGEWKIKDKDLRALYDCAQALLLPFGRVRCVHQDRAETVRVLGH